MVDAEFGGDLDRRSGGKLGRVIDSGVYVRGKLMPAPACLWLSKLARSSSTSSGMIDDGLQHGSCSPTSWLDYTLNAESNGSRMVS